MKKYLSVLFVAVFALVLTGCGKGNTLKCSTEEDGQKANVEVSFKGDKVNKVVTTMELASKEEAESYAALYNAFAGSQEGMTVKADGKKFTITLSGKALESEGLEGKKADVKKQLEEQGYKCK